MNLEVIARLAGVSRSTVSRVINDHPSVDPNTRERVLQVIREHNFQPNAVARSLASRRSRLIGFFTPLRPFHTIFSSAYYPTLFQGLSNACEANGYNLIYAPLSKDESVLRLVRSRFVDGVILGGWLFNNNYVDQILSEKIPSVLIGRHPQRNDAAWVDADNFSGGQLAAQHLVRLGYRRFGLINGQPDRIVVQDRRNGFVSYLSSKGIDFDTSLECYVNFSVEGAYKAANHFLTLPSLPEAIFIAGDELAVNVIRAFENRSLRIPDDIAIVGFDDLPLLSSPESRLTTIRQPVEDIGYAAITLLLKLIDNSNQQIIPPEDSKHVVLPVDLVVRESCGIHLPQRIHNRETNV